MERTCMNCLFCNKDGACLNNWANEYCEAVPEDHRCDRWAGPVTGVNPTADKTEGSPDMVNQPPHYTQGGVECIDAIQAAVTGKDPYEAWLVGQVIKYLWRYNFKNGYEDVRKAEFYLKRLVLCLAEKDVSRMLEEEKQKRSVTLPTDIFKKEQSNDK